MRWLDKPSRTSRGRFAMTGVSVVLLAGAFMPAYPQTQELITAASTGDLASVKALLAKGVDVNSRSRDGQTALIWATENGHNETVQALLSAGSDVNAKSNDGKTALIWAALHGELTIAQGLISKGADINAMAADGETALSAAAEHLGEQRGGGPVRVLEGRAKVRTFLVGVLEKRVGPATTLSDAVDRGDAASVKALISKGADVNAPLNDGSTALVHSSRYGDLAVVKALLSAGARVNVSSSEPNALYWAIEHGHGPVISALLEKGADVNVKWKGGYTPLVLAIQYTDLPTVQAILAKVADVNSMDDTGRTALYRAVDFRRGEVVRLLLENGASVSTKGQSGRQWVPLVAACRDGNIDVTEMLLGKDIDIEARDSEGATALIAAAQNGHVEVLGDLIAKGADVNARRNDGKSAIILAYQRGFADLVKVLRAKGADSSGVPAEWNTQTFGQLREKYMIEVERILKRKGYYDGDVGVLQDGKIEVALSKFQHDNNISETMAVPHPATERALGTTFNPNKACFWYKSGNSDALYCPPETGCTTSMMAHSSVASGGFPQVDGYRISCPARKDEIMSLPPAGYK